MKIESCSFDHDSPIPSKYAFCRIDPENHATFSDNISPELCWSDLPEGTKSLVLLCVDPDVPTRPDDVNQEGRSVRADLPRTRFVHWVMVDIPPSCTGVGEGECSSGVIPRGKQDPPGPAGTRQGMQDYTGWFEGDAEMGGKYFGYDGPAPPWNDEIIHHYHFQIYATNLDRCPVDGDFCGVDVVQAIKDNILGEAEIVGTYTLNPKLASD